MREQCSFWQTEIKKQPRLPAPLYEPPPELEYHTESEVEDEIEAKTPPAEEHCPSPEEIPAPPPVQAPAKNKPAPTPFTVSQRLVTPPAEVTAVNKARRMPGPRDDRAVEEYVHS